MPTPADFLTTSLRTHPHGAAVTRILSAAIAAVEPGAAVRQFAHREGARLHINGQPYNLEETGRIHILGVGKAAPAMANALAALLADHPTRGLLIVKHAPATIPAGFDLAVGGHPIPNEASLQAGSKALQLASALTERDLFICLISGGGSALMTAPRPGLTLPDLQSLTAALLACGARIHEINTLRRRLDQVKGGGLAAAAAPARVISLILSDVVGNPLETIASGPTAGDPSTQAHARDILTRYALWDKIPPAVRDILQNGDETPKPGHPLFARVQNVIVGSNLLAAQAALRQAELEGLTACLLRTDLQGEARQAAVKMCQSLRRARQRGHPVRAPFCMAAGGETTVTLNANPGRGGRNTELALAAVTRLAGQANAMLVTLATDGEDGPTDAAGAVVTGDTLHRAAQLGLRPAEFLSRHNSYTFFDTLGDLLKPGPTGTNVNDLTFLFSF